MIRAAAGNKELTRWEVTGWKDLGDNGKDGKVAVVVVLLAAAVGRGNGAEGEEEREDDGAMGGKEVVGNGNDQRTRNVEGDWVEVTGLITGWNEYEGRGDGSNRGRDMYKMAG